MANAAGQDSSRVGEQDSRGQDSSAVARTLEALERIVSRIPQGGERRQGQLDMSALVASSVEQQKHLIVQAGTGTGKSLAYLVPTVLSNQRTVIATATKTLQDQLAEKDIPFVAEHLGVDIDFAVLKGRSNYLCMQLLEEARRSSTLPTPQTLSLLETHSERQSPDDTEASDNRNGTDWNGTSDNWSVEASADFHWLTDDTLDELINFSERTESGDRSDLDITLSDKAWQSLSVSHAECPGAANCPSGDICFAEKAKTKAALADIVVVNLHLYALNLLYPGILGDHDTVVIDEAHQLEDIVSSALGKKISPGRLSFVSRSARACKVTPDLCEALDSSASALKSHLASLAGQRLTFTSTNTDMSTETDVPSETNMSTKVSTKPNVVGNGDSLLSILDTAATEVLRIWQEMKEKFARAADTRKPKLHRVVMSIDALLADINAIRSLDGNDIIWVERINNTHINDTHTLRTTPLQVGRMLSHLLWNRRTAVLTSATIPLALHENVGLPLSTTQAKMESPFDYQRNALIYTARRLPTAPRSMRSMRATKRRSSTAQHATSSQSIVENQRFDELETLINASQGRTLALYTSYAAMHKAAKAMKERLRWPVLVQNSQSRARLIKQFKYQEHTSLFATFSFWQGVDVPGRSCSLVVIDKLPFPRPNDPVLQARREIAGDNAFYTIDMSHAATLLTQGAGRLIRTSSDRGVVAVLDSRLVTRGYGRTLFEYLPPMSHTTSLARTVEFLQAITSG